MVATAASVAVAADPAFSASGAVAASVGINIVDDVVVAEIVASRIDVTGALVVAASTAPDITSAAIGIAVAVSGSAGGTAAVALGGAATATTTSMSSSARISDSLVADGRGITAGSVSVRASDVSTISGCPSWRRCRWRSGRRGRPCRSGSRST